MMTEHESGSNAGRKTDRRSLFNNITLIKTVAWAASLLIAASAFTFDFLHRPIIDFLRIKTFEELNRSQLIVSKDKEAPTVANGVVSPELIQAHVVKALGAKILASSYNPSDEYGVNKNRQDAFLFDNSNYAIITLLIDLTKDRNQTIYFKSPKNNIYGGVINGNEIREDRSSLSQAATLYEVSITNTSGKQQTALLKVAVEGIAGDYELTGYMRYSEKITVIGMAASTMFLLGLVISLWQLSTLNNKNGQHDDILNEILQKNRDQDSALLKLTGLIGQHEDMLMSHKGTLGDINKSVIQIDKVLSLAHPNEAMKITPPSPISEETRQVAVEPAAKQELDRLSLKPPSDHSAGRSWLASMELPEQGAPQ